MKDWRSDPLIRAIGLLGVRPGRVVLAILAGVGAIGSAIALAAVSAWLIARASQMPPVLHLTVAVVAVRAFGDRKSTRLNSSHVASSYAVFCLKKNKVFWREYVQPSAER